MQRKYNNVFGLKPTHAVVLPTIIFAHCRQISGDKIGLITASKAFFSQICSYIAACSGLLHWHFAAFCRCIRLIYKSATTFVGSLEVFTAPATF